MTTDEARQYNAAIETYSDHIWSMRQLADVLADALEREGLAKNDYSVDVTGPPELRIGKRYR